VVLRDPSLLGVVVDGFEGGLGQDPFVLHVGGEHGDTLLDVLVVAVAVDFRLTLPVEDNVDASGGGQC